MAKDIRQPRPLRLSSLLVLLLFILLAYGLRLHNLDSFSFWTDEGLTPLRSGYSVAEILSNRVIIQEGVTRDTHPPFFYLIIHFSRRLLGETDFAYRYPALLAGVLLTPLLFQFGRRLYATPLGLTTAWLAAINPLQIWYANEARMYTILVLLAAAASYTLWRAFAGPALWRSLCLYIVLASLAFYTHYTAIFLIGGQSIFWAWLLWHKGQQRLLIAAAITGILVTIPLIPFTVPRLLAGAEADYFYVSPFIMLQDVAHFFNLGLTTNFNHLSVKLLDIAVLGLLLLGVYAAQTWLRRSFLLVYLLAVVFGLMAGSLIKPMYQGVRHIMAGSPAFLLLVAWGIVYLYEVRRGLAFMGVIVVLTGAAVSLNNLYNNRQYAKDDFRALVQYVDQKAGERDIVIYNNAILLPLHEHYQVRPDVAVTALPIYPRFATSAVGVLETLGQSYDRIWFVTDPPADKRDEEQLIRGWLDSHLPVVDERNFPARTTVVKVIAYATAPQVIATLPENGRSLAWQWPDMPPLQGIHLDFSQPAILPTLWLDLFWQGGSAPEANRRLRFILRGPDGKEWLIREQALAGEAAGIWPQNGLIRLSYHLPVPVGTPPGMYTLLLQPLASSTGRPLGEVQPLTEVALAASTSWPAPPERLFDPQPFTASSALVFANGLALRGVQTADPEVRPGHTLPLTLYWQANSTLLLPNDVRYELEVIGSDGEVLRTQSDAPGASWLTTWPAGALIKEDTGIYFRPGETAPGRYRLRWRLLQGEEVVPVRPSWRPWPSESVFLGEVEVRPWPLVTTLPAGVTLLQAEYGSAIQLYGYDLVNSDDRLHLTLYWQAQATSDNDYYTFVHLVAASGEIVINENRVPVEWLRPTRGWRAGEVLTDSYSLTLPADLPPGDYDLNVGLYNSDSGERLPVMLQGEWQANNQLTLTTVTWP